ncbi:MAG TPA: HD-GYP domain-containing protein [Syntrophomonas sp.]|nr:HD-GYP domain-containing protein [Syntrophomonas sp.]
MIKLSSSRITAGMVLGRPIINSKHKFLLTAGQVLTERYVYRIKEIQIPFIYVDAQLGIEDPEPLISPANFTSAINSVKQCYEQYSKTLKIDVKDMKSHVDNIIDDLTSNSSLTIGMAELKDYDDYTYQHSVNVCALAIILGISNGYNRFQLQNLGIGALLHDIGKIKIPLEIINKPGALTYEEYIEVKKHPWEGFMIAKTVAYLPKSSIQCILQHHERFDGRGYPRGLSQGNIHEYASIVAVADVFDALVSDRPYRPGFSNHEAIELMEREKDSRLSGPLVDKLLSQINIYPPGTMVGLSNGDLGVVTHENSKDPKKPQLRLMFDLDNQVYEITRSLDLSRDENIFITKVLNQMEAEEKMLQYLKINKMN